MKARQEGLVSEDKITEMMVEHKKKATKEL